MEIQSYTEENENNEKVKIQKSVEDLLIFMCISEGLHVCMPDAYRALKRVLEPLEL